MKEPGQRPFAGLDLRRPKGYPAVSTAPAPAAAAEEEEATDPCPRCESRDTKFCYYNNYNTSQPRHYCRSCRRYWTKGGSLRNVPVGGGSRKTASSSSSSSSSAASPKRAKNSKRRRVALAAPTEPEPGTTEAAENEAMAGTIGYPATDVDAARDTANGTVAIGDPATAVDEARAEATANGTVGDRATAMDAAPTEATANGTVDDPVIASDAPRPEATAPNGTIDGPATVLDAARTEATADGAIYPGAPPAVDDACFASGGKEAPDLSPFEWPSGCDLGSYWAPGVYADTDTDPVLFLNLP